MNVKSRQIEVDVRTAETLEAKAAARGISVSELVADLVDAAADMPADLEALRAKGQGPWSPAIIAEDARRLADYHETGEGVPWDEVRAWMQSWGSADELPPPRARKL